MPEREQHREDRNGKPDPYRPGRGTLDEEREQNGRHSGYTAERVAENHGPAVLCAVSTDQILSAFDAGIVELVPLSKQGTVQTRRTDEPESDAQQREYWRTLFGLRHA